MTTCFESRSFRPAAQLLLVLLLLCRPQLKSVGQTCCSCGRSAGPLFPQSVFCGWTGYRLRVVLHRLTGGGRVAQGAELQLDLISEVNQASVFQRLGWRIKERVSVEGAVGAVGASVRLCAWKTHSSTALFTCQRCQSGLELPPPPLPSS